MSTCSRLWCLGILVAVVCSAQRRAPDSPPALSGGKVIVMRSPAWVPHSLDALIDKSELIVDGVVTQVLPSRLWNPDDSISHCTDSVITVNRVLKGSISRKLVVFERGGRVGGVEIVTPQDTLMEQGKRYILFLTKDRAVAKPEVGDNEYFGLTGLWNGKFSVEDGRVLSSREATPELKTLDRLDVEDFLKRVVERVATAARTP